MEEEDHLGRAKLSIQRLIRGGITEQRLELIKNPGVEFRSI